MMGRGNYVLSMYHYSFNNACLRDARHGTDHLMVLTVLRGEGVHGNLLYMRVRMLWPIMPSAAWSQSEGEANYKALNGDIDRTPQPTTPVASCISPKTCQLSDRRPDLQRSIQASDNKVRQARHNFQRSLREDRQ